VDDIDRELLTALIADGRLTYQQLASRVLLSANSTAERVRRLRQAGVLAGVHAELDLASIGRTLQALTDLKLRDSVARQDFEASLGEVPQVQSAVHTTGEYDYQLRLACTDTADLQAVVDTVRALGAREVHSRIVLGELRFDPSRLLARADPTALRGSAGRTVPVKSGRYRRRPSDRAAPSGAG
jgi:Lrp/AsnC family leucine-responsive transcriptional regulator